MGSRNLMKISKFQCFIFSTNSPILPFLTSFGTERNAAFSIPNQSQTTTPPMTVVEVELYPVSPLQISGSNSHQASTSNKKNLANIKSTWELYLKFVHHLWSSHTKKYSNQVPLDLKLLSSVASYFTFILLIKV